MQVGVIFPQTEIGQQADAIKTYAQTAESLGYSHILAYDHVLGANPASRPGCRDCGSRPECHPAAHG